MSKISFLLISLIYSINDYACSYHGADQVYCNSEALEDSFANMPFASDGLCDDQRYLQEAKAQYEQFPKSSKIVSRKINGKRIKGTKKELEILKKMTQGYLREQKKVMDAFDNCEDVFCVLKSAFGNEESAYRALNIAYRSGYAVSLQSKSNADYIWNKQELRNLNYSVNVMPSHMLDSDTLGEFIVLPNHAYPGGKRGVGGLASPSPKKSGNILFTELIRKNNGAYANQIMIHEMIHHYDYQNLFKTGQYRSDEGGYCEQNGWRKETKVVEKYGVKVEEDVWIADKENACYITDYASRRPREDFAEAITFYILTPEKLKKKCPQNYEYLKQNHFNGKEYSSSDFNQNLDQYIVDNEKELKKCLSVDLSSLYLADKIYFHKTDNKNTHTLHSSTKTHFSEKCLENLIEVANGFIPDAPLACTNKLVPHNIKNTINNMISKHFSHDLIQNIKKFITADSLAAYSGLCLSQKDLTDECIKKQILNAIEEAGYPKDMIKHVNLTNRFKFKRKLPQIEDNFSLLNESLNNYYPNLKYATSSVYALKTYPEDELLAYLTKEGYRLDYNAKKFLGEQYYNQISSPIFKTLQDKILNKTLSEHKTGCRKYYYQKCVKDKIKAVFMQDHPDENFDSLDQFVKIVYDYLYNYQKDTK